ncbi:MAG: hypothetical protein QOH74_1548, partial [Gaiellales bacterium]|nr:hypothetical protein [Gaiellales bacterium]
MLPHAGFPPRRSSTVLLLACGLAAAAAVPAQARLDQKRVTLSVSFVQKPAVNAHATSAAFRWKRIGFASRTTCRLDKGAFRSCKGGRVTYRRLREGVHRLTLKVRGRTVTRTISFTWRVDVTAPAAPATVAGGSPAWGTASRTLTAAGATDTGSGLLGYQFQLSRDGGLTWSAPQMQNPVTVNTAGESVVRFRALDKALN